MPLYLSSRPISEMNFDNGCLRLLFLIQVIIRFIIGSSLTNIFPENEDHKLTGTVNTPFVLLPLLFSYEQTVL